ncbi:ABC transporter permease [Pelagibius litoralis]|uniref:ABC transporter permease n=1 Tax=Pelagibius litoralis TaxID=374515 RepID=A0A967EZR4_9PROT|nr:ABC transporter permease [Pelagibius litoralis]NIA70436.1 ABC transporter permease [Pelagibius litoralis]
MLFVAGASIFFLVMISAILAPWIAPHSPAEIVMSNKLMAPGIDHPMGTDKFGRDIFSRVLFGAQISLTVGVCVVALAVLIGAPIGLLSGYFGGKLDTALMRISDVFLAFPPLLLPIAITAALGPGLWNAMIALAVSWFPWYARIVRGAVMRVRKELYIDAARTMGVSHLRIMLRHVTPNSLTPVIVQGSMDFGYAILAAASLSFIGLGARPPTIEWGLMAAAARTQFLDQWWTALGPGLAIFLTVLAINLVGDGLRDVLDPKHGRRE